MIKRVVSRGWYGSFLVCNGYVGALQKNKNIIEKYLTKAIDFFAELLYNIFIYRE